MNKRISLSLGSLPLAALMLPTALTLARAASVHAPVFVTPVAKEYRHRANILLVDNSLPRAVLLRLQEIMRDDANLFCPAAPVANLEAVAAGLDPWLNAKTWDAIFLGVQPSVSGETGASAEENKLREIVVKLKKRHVLTLWGSAVPDDSGSDDDEVVRENGITKNIMQAAGVPLADLYGSWLAQRAGGGDKGLVASTYAATLAVSLRRLLLSQSTPWAELPATEIHDPAHLLADPQLLASPDDLALARGTTATVYRAEANGWQFNLHPFIAHHDGNFWAMWSSGRVDEDSSSQLLRYATSADGSTWSKAQILAPDPDGEAGPWRWMASGIYENAGRLFALGSLSRGNRNGQVWADARLVRFEWTGDRWKEDGVVADNCVVYFPPLKVAGREFFVWRDSEAHFSTAYRPSAGGSWEVTRLPGPLPDYRMSETSAYVDPKGVVHLIIRDQGGTHRIYHSVSYDRGTTWTLPVKTNYPDAVSKNCSGRLSNGWYFLINNPKTKGANSRDPLAISFSRDGWTFGLPMALRKSAPPLRYPGKAKGSHSFQYSHAIEYGGELCVIYATNKEDIEASFFDLAQFHLTP